MRRFLPLAIALASAASVAPATAQHFVDNDPVLQHIWRLGMDSSHAYDLAQTLFDSIGPRLTGSPGQKAGNDWLVKTYQSWGIPAHNEKYGTWRGWRRGYSHIDLIAPRVRSLEATLEGYSPGTGGKNLDAGTVILPDVKDSDAFVHWLPAVKGKFVLISPSYPTCRPEDEWDQIATPDERARMDTTIVMLTRDWTERIRNTGYPVTAGNPTGKLGMRLEEAGAAGVIVSNFANPLSEAWGTYTVYDTKNQKTPAIAMSCEDYSLVYRLTEHHQGPKLRVNAVAQPLGTVPVFNTVATIRGSEKPDEYILLSAHFDSWDGGSGATDNGTGTITMLEAMRILKLAYPHPKRTIMVGHWSGEEQGLIGSHAFSEDHPEIVKGLEAQLNQDNGTGRIQSTSGVGLPDAGAHMQAWLAKLPQEFQDQVHYTGLGGPATGGTDNASFDCWGAPGFGLSSIAWDYGTYTHHTNRDTFDKIVFDEVKGNATITAMLAYLASEDPTFIQRDTSALAREGGNGRGGFGRGTPSGRAELSAALGGGAGGRGRGGRSGGWPSCPKAPRSFILP